MLSAVQSHQGNVSSPVRPHAAWPGITDRRHTLQCPDCGAATQAEWPPEMPTGSFGPRTEAVVAFLTGRLGASHRDVVEAMETLHGLELGLGSVAAIEQRVSESLTGPVAAAQQYVEQQLTHHVDETGWREETKHCWLWVHATTAVTVFRILAGRGKAQAQEVIGQQFRGVVNTDRYNAYHWIDPRKRQICSRPLKTRLPGDERAWRRVGADRLGAAGADEETLPLLP